jgi:hypothetical protein
MAVDWLENLNYSMPSDNKADGTADNQHLLWTDERTITHALDVFQRL